MAISYFVVMGIVAGCDLECAGAELPFNVVISNHGDFTVQHGHQAGFSYQVAVALVLGVHSHSRITQDGLRPGGGNRNAFF